jgi:mRNA-degrading endonuclease toxin of MazEF toxin-antitoxin module
VHGPHQIRTISKLRLTERIAVLADENLKTENENRVLEHLGIEFEAEGWVESQARG